MLNQKFVFDRIFAITKRIEFQYVLQKTFFHFSQLFAHSIDSLALLF